MTCRWNYQPAEQPTNRHGHMRVDKEAPLPIWVTSYCIKCCSIQKFETFREKRRGNCDNGDHQLINSKYSQGQVTRSGNRSGHKTSCHKVRSQGEVTKSGHKANFTRSIHKFSYQGQVTRSGYNIRSHGQVTWLGHKVRSRGHDDRSDSSPVRMFSCLWQV